MEHDDKITTECTNCGRTLVPHYFCNNCERPETKRKNGQVEANVREWEDMDNAPKDQPLILKDDNGFIYVGEYNHNYGYFGQYTDEGVVEHQHAMKWKPLPTT